MYVPYVHAQEKVFGCMTDCYAITIDCYSILVIAVHASMCHLSSSELTDFLQLLFIVTVIAVHTSMCHLSSSELVCVLLLICAATRGLWQASVISIDHRLTVNQGSVTQFDC
jgi:hypothetical protein